MENSHKPRIVFVDDEPELAGQVSLMIPNNVRETHDVVVLDLEAMGGAVEALFERGRAVARGASVDEARKEFPSAIDGSALAVIDYDLLGTAKSREWATGLEVARLARAYGTASSIVLLNQFQGNRFDLNMVEAVDSSADLDLYREQLANEGLWASGGFVGFRPWQWPDLRHEPTRSKRL